MQMPNDNVGPQDPALDAPPGLVSALKRLPQTRPFVPPTLDDAVLRAAQRHLVAPQKNWFAGVPLIRWLAAATATATVVLLTWHFIMPSSEQRLGYGTRRWFGSGPGRRFDAEPGPIVGSAPVRERFNQNGHVDILDALVLAKQLKSGPVADLRWDVNGDGVVDERDLQAIAAQAVRLGKRGRS